MGVGASAGGIEACGALLEAVPPNSGLAFILVLHLDPRAASQLAEILQRRAAHLTLVQAQGTVAVEADHAYVIAPDSKLRLLDGALEVEALDEARSHVVDYLFSSLAEFRGTRAVGVVLSGGASDGTQGLRQIRESGGLAIAQAPDTAFARSMPESAIEAGVVDAVLAPSDIPPVLLSFAEDGTRPPRLRQSSDPADREKRRHGEAVEQSVGFRRILDELATSFDVNFADYKIGTLERRTRRRMGLLGIEDWDAYAARVAGDPDELEALYRDLLIGVTEFFRDPEVWDQLAAELDRLLEGRAEPGVRAWVAGCATGEEAYTLAMVLLERLPARAWGRVQIYATDLDERALAAARRAIYPAEALERLGEERRNRWFHQHDGHLLKLDQPVRDCVTFAPQNVLTDPPFSRMDVVCCRNLLIYLKQPAHDRLLSCLHFALRAGGLLLLGRSEAVDQKFGFFDEISKRHGLFRARAVTAGQRFHPSPRLRDRARAADGPAMATEPPLPSRRRELGPERRIEQYVLRTHAPGCVAINSELEIRYFYGQTARYLVPPTGESRTNLLAWIRPDFNIHLRAALARAIETGEALSAQGQIERDDWAHRVECTIEPLPVTVGVEGLWLVTFRDVGEGPSEPPDVVGARDPVVVRELERELVDTQYELQSTVEQLDSILEEHRAGHEELQSLNEELQSSNEELEASKEELEALNEEMNTINRELEEKNADLRQTNDDLRNLFENVGVPTIFLDRELKIRRYTGAATDVLRLVPSDIGRSIEHIKERIQDSSTAEKSKEVVRTGEVDRSEVWGEGRCYVRTISPYRTAEGGLEGVCITFADVTAQQNAMRYAEEVVAAARTPLLVLDPELRIVTVNRSFEESFAPAENLEGRLLSECRDERWNVPQLDERLQQLLRDRKGVDDFEVVSSERAILVNGRWVRTGEQQERVVLSFEDLTAQRNHAREALKTEALQEEARRKDEWIAMLGHELRNPMAAVQNGVELLKSASLSPQERDVVEMLRRQGRHIGDLLDSLLDAARIASGKLSIARDAVDLEAVARAAIETVQPLMDERRHEFETSLPPAGSLWVTGDATRLTEVVVNLLTNSARYTEPGGRVTLAITSDADAARISVRDTGKGISRELLPRIFETLTQGPRDLARSERGLGLGLPIVRALVQLHGGRVEASSEGEGRGATFEVTLPRRKAGPEETAAEAERPPGTRPRRILIVDDERDAAQSLELLIRMRGHETRSVAEASLALRAAESFEPEVALLDLGLPDMDGYQLARQLRNRFPDLVLIAVTGYRRDEPRLAAAGFDEHLMKPVDLGRLDELFRDAVPEGRSE